MAEFAPAVETLLAIEGGFAPRDNRAGAVNWGITEAFLRGIGIDADEGYVRELSREKATDLYERYFWREFRLGEIQDQRLAERLFLALVNSHPSVPIKMLQDVVGVEVDGLIGPKTIAAVNAANPDAVWLGLRSKLLTRYKMLANGNPAEYGDDLPGWVRRLDAI